MGFKEKLNTRQVALGTMLSEIATANVARIMKTAGFEFLIIDCEHGYFDFSQLANIISVGNGFNIPVLVRIPLIERGYITKVLDMGGDGFLVPMVNTSEQARRVVEFAKYAPQGKRGISTTRAQTNYNPPPLSEYVKIANQRTILLVQLETKEAVSHAEAIASVEGIDALMIGPNDLACDLGKPGEVQTEEMMHLIRKVIEAAKKAGKPCGIIESKIPFLRTCRSEGMNIFSCGSEVGMMMKSAKAIVKELGIV
jgi:2-dehydro-3-deoxyglucarate aldolase/4-hydroxy-2-oxoheptanedioate aldolase